MNTQPKPSEIIIMASGVVAFVFSFFDWFGEGRFSLNAWDTNLTFPLATYIGIFGLIMALQIAVTRFANVEMPARVAGFTWPQIHLALAVYCGLLAIGWLIIGEQMKFGFWLSFVAAIGLVVGAVMLHMESTPTAARRAPGTPPSGGPGAPPPSGGPGTPPPSGGPGTPPPSGGPGTSPPPPPGSTGV
jgi:hypothetical protein